jgi:hypothetical protein
MSEEKGQYVAASGSFALSEVDEQAIEAVAQFAYDRHSGLYPHDVVGFSQEELEQFKIDSSGYIVFTVERVHITEKTIEDGVETWYVKATLDFGAFEGSTDLYQAYPGNDGEWVVDWYAS